MFQPAFGRVSCPAVNAGHSPPNWFSVTCAIQKAVRSLLAYTTSTPAEDIRRQRKDMQLWRKIWLRCENVGKHKTNEKKKRKETRQFVFLLFFISIQMEIENTN